MSILNSTIRTVKPAAGCRGKRRYSSIAVGFPIRNDLSISTSAGYPSFPLRARVRRVRGRAHKSTGV